MVLDTDRGMDLQDMDSDPRDGLVEPHYNLTLDQLQQQHQQHQKQQQHHRGRSREHLVSHSHSHSHSHRSDLDPRHHQPHHLPPLQHQPQQHHLHHLDPIFPPQFHHNLSPGPDHYDDAGHDRLSLSPASYTAENLDPNVAANAHHAFAAVNPDDYYASYRGLHVSSNPESPMAASIPRQSLRPNGDATTPKHPVVSPNRAFNRGNLRSASNPVDNRPSAAGYKPLTPSGHPSVRDLKKRFDQNGVSSIPRAPAHGGAAARVKRDPSTSAQPRNGATSYSTIRSGVTQEASSETSNPTSPRSQRPKFVAEDQVSNNSQSFASRIGKPRNSVSGNPNASKSLTNLPPKSPPPPRMQTASSPTNARSQGLLFGEILPEQRDAITAGYGIEGIRQRRTSESGLQDHWSHQRSLSDPDAEPLSPTWYRSVNGESSTGQTQKEHSQRGHSRSQSDVPASKSTKPVHRKPVTRRPPSSNGSVSGSSSKLPRSVRKLSSPTGSTSPSSTRSNSPSATKRTVVNGRRSRAGTAASAAKAPASRTKTPTPASGGRKAAPRALVTPNSNNTRLKANIIAPPPKLSPPLRSSRPRQPVSMATTASSRMKAVERARSPNPISRLPTRIPEPTQRRRKISVGPIDFEQRREHIRLAYSKSIRETQAQEARQQAALQRKREMEAAAKAKAAAAAVAAAAATASSAQSDIPSRSDASDVPGGTPNLEPASAEVSPIDDIPPIPDIPFIHQTSPIHETFPPREEDADHGIPIIADIDTDQDIESVDAASYEQPVPPSETSSVIAAEVAPVAPPVALPISIDSTIHLSQTEISPRSFDSPTLGIPGSFPALSPPIGVEQRPQTATSTRSDSTEFDIDDQATPPVHTQSPLGLPITIVKPPSPQQSRITRQRSEYRYPFQDEPVSPDEPPTSQETVLESHVFMMQPQVDSPVIPGDFNGALDDDRDRPSEPQSPFETTITIMPPPGDLRLDDEPEDTIPFPRMELQYESDCRSEVDHDQTPHHESRYDEDEITDSCAEETDDHQREIDYRSESHFDDQVSSHRASTCESSEVDGIEDRRYSAFDQQQTPDTSRGLTVPIHLPADRTSQQSGWTDYSVESGDISDATKSPALEDPDDDSASHGHVTIFETRSIHRESRPTSRPQDTRYSQQDVRPSMDSTHSMNYFSQHHLPELDTGDGFSIPYLKKSGSKGSYSYVPSPNHEPPPVPTPVSESTCNSQRTSAVFYDQSQYGSTLVQSERGSEDYAPTMATPQSMDTGSFGPQDQYFPSTTAADSDVKSETQEKPGPTGKEKTRLVQRRNVIKELVDTEAVFVRDMNIVEEIYKGTAEACPKLDGQTVKLIFRNTDEIIAFHTSFLSQIKEAVASVYAPQIRRSALSREGSFMSEPGQFNAGELDDAKDRATSIGPVFQANMENMKLAHEGFLRNSDQAAKQLIQIQQDPTVKVWLNECNEVAKDLTAAWDLDSLLIKPMQRITKYPNLIITLLQHTPQDHPDREALVAAKDALEAAIIEINKTKKNFELVGQIVGRKRKESDVKAGFARAFGKRVDKLQASGNRAPEDPEYAKINEKFGDDYLRLQVVLRDVEFYTRQVSAYVHEFLQYLSSIELVMRLQPGNYPELEAKWVQFNISIRDLEKVALEEHLSQVRKHVIEPFELVIKAYGNPSLAMKKRQKRRVDFERYEQLKKSGKSADSKLKELVEQYDALNDTLKKELPKLSTLTEKVGNICLGNFVNIQVKWYGIWKEKMKVVLGECPDLPDLKEVVSTFQRDFPYAQDQIANIGILNPTYKGRVSQSTTASVDDSLLKVRSRPSDIDSGRGRGLSLNADMAPSLPAPEFVKRNSGSFTMSPTTPGGGPMPSPHHYYYREYYMGVNNHQQNVPSPSPLTPEVPQSSRSFVASTRPSTSRSFDSGGMARQSSDSTNYPPPRESTTTYNSTYTTQEGRRFSGLFHSALPLPDGPEDSQRSSRASSRERVPAPDGYNVLWLAASLFEFNIATTKHEAGYPYLVYQAGEIFDVIAEKGELWLAKNQDDPASQVGWIWSKHFVKLVDA